MVEYLNNTYREVAQEDITDLKGKLTESYNPITIILKYFDKLEDLKTMVTGDPTTIHNNELIADTYVSIKNTSIYDRAIKE